MINFSKGHAYGNDFLYVLSRDVPAARLDRLAQEMCDRHTGVGADGLIVYELTSEGASMRLFNADGGRAEVSGNGVRALGALLLRDDHRPQADLDVATEGGIKRLTRMSREDTRQMFRAFMGVPSDVRRLTVDVASEAVDLVVLDMGNPQAIILGPLPDDVRFQRIGSALERHRTFREGTNVEFAHVEAPDRVRIRIWERGVGPTLSSGTGSCASLVAAAAFGGASKDAAVISPGGSQRVEWLEDGVYLTGWAEIVCDGQWLRPLPGI
jgi:diaminopimelate epimerase